MNKYRKTARIGIIAFLMFVVNVGYAADLYVGFRGVHSPANKIYTEKLFSKNSVVPIRFSGGRRATSQQAPSMAKFNGNFYMAYTDDSSNRIYYSWSQDASHWADPYPILSLKSRSTPHLQVFKGRLYMFYRRSDNQLFYTSTADGINWSSIRDAGGDSLYAATSTVYKGKLFITYRGEHRTNLYVNWTADGIHWHGERKLNESSNSRPYIAVHNNKLFIAFKGLSTNNIYLIRSLNGVDWSGKWQPNGNWETHSGPAIASFNNRLYLTHIGRNTNKVRYSSSANGINSWSPLYERYNAHSLGTAYLSVY